MDAVDLLALATKVVKDSTKRTKDVTTPAQCRSLLFKSRVKLSYNVLSKTPNFQFRPYLWRLRPVSPTTRRRNAFPGSRCRAYSIAHNASRIPASRAQRRALPPLSKSHIQDVRTPSSCANLNPPPCANCQRLGALTGVGFVPPLNAPGWAHQLCTCWPLGTAVERTTSPSQKLKLKPKLLTQQQSCRRVGVGITANVNNI